MRITASYNNRVWKGKSDYYDEKGSPEDCEEISVRSAGCRRGKRLGNFLCGETQAKNRNHTGNQRSLQNY